MDNFDENLEKIHVMLAYTALRAFGFGYINKWTISEIERFAISCTDHSDESPSPYGKTIPLTYKSIRNLFSVRDGKFIDMTNQTFSNAMTTFESFGKTYNEIQVTQKPVQIGSSNFKIILNEQLIKFGHEKDPLNEVVTEVSNEFPVHVINFILEKLRLTHSIDLDKMRQNQDRELKEGGITNPTNKYLISKSLCEALEFNSKSIGVKVITSDLLWANYFMDQIIDATSNDNTFMYLLMGQDSSPKEDFLEKIKERTQKGKIQVVFACNPFPIPHDIVIYDNISDSLAIDLGIKHLVGSHGKGKNNFLGIQGVSHFRHETREIQTDVVHISPKKVYAILNWFDRTFREKSS